MEHNENDTPTRDYQQRHRDHSKESTGSPGVEKPSNQVRDPLSRVFRLPRHRLSKPPKRAKENPQCEEQKRRKMRKKRPVRLCSVVRSTQAEGGSQEEREVAGKYMKKE